MTNIRQDKYDENTAGKSARILWGWDKSIIVFSWIRNNSQNQVHQWTAADSKPDWPNLKTGWKGGRGKYCWNCKIGKIWMECQQKKMILGHLYFEYILSICCTYRPTQIKSAASKILPNISVASMSCLGCCMKSSKNYISHMERPHKCVTCMYVVGICAICHVKDMSLACESMPRWRDVLRWAVLLPAL